MSIAAGLLPEVVHETLAAVLLVDLERGEVTYANAMADQLAPGVRLPIAVDDWSRAAGLKASSGEDLDEDSAGSHPLSRVASGHPVYGEAVTAERASETTRAREPLWVLGLPMTGGPHPVDNLAVVVFLPLRNASAVADVQEQAVAMRERALLATRIAFTITDPSTDDNPLIWVNPAFTDTTGYTLEDSVGRNCRFLQGPDTDRRVVDEIRQSVERAVPITTTLLNYRKDGTPFWNQVTISPVSDRDGNVTHFVGVQTDVSDRVHAERSREAALVRAETASYRLNLIASFARDLGSALNPDEVIRRTSRFLVPRLGTWCASFFFDDERRLQPPTIAHERSGDPRITAAVDELTDLLPDWLDADGPLQRILTGVDPHLMVADAREQFPTARSLLNDERTAELVRRLGLAGLLMVPMVARGSVIGALVVGTDDRRPPLSSDDLALVSDLAGRAALAYDNAVLYTQQRDAAEILQRGLLPVLPSIPGLQICAEYLPATARVAVGGDWYDVFRLSDDPSRGRVGVTVGDVMGHDLNAAAVMGQLRSALLAYGYAGTSPGAVLDQLDGLVGGMELGQLATCLYGILNLNELATRGVARFDFASAGHPSPILIQPDGTTAPLDGGIERMIGVSKLLPAAAARHGVSADLPAGSTLVCYTDGLLDAFGTDLEESMAELCELIAQQPDAGCTGLVARLVDRVHESGRTDDVAVLVLKIG